MVEAVLKLFVAIFRVAPERLSKRRYVLILAKYSMIVTGRDLFLTILLIEGNLIATIVTRAWTNWTQAFHSKRIG